MRTARPPLRLGLILDDSQTPLWVHSFVEQLRAAAHLEVVAIVFGGRPRTSRSLPLLLRLWLLLEKWYFGEAPSPWLPESRTYPVEVIHLMPVERKGAVNCSDVALTRIGALDLDVLVQLGSSELPAAIFGCARYGVWTVAYHGHPNTNPECALLSLIYSGRRTCELVLRSTSRGLRSYVLYRSSIDIHAVSLYKNLMLDQQRRFQILLRRLFNLFDRGWNSIAVEEDDLQVTDKVRGPSTGVLFLARLFARCVRRALSKLWFEEQWIVALSSERDPGTAPRRTLQQPISVMVPRPGHNHADPFLFARDGKTYMFFEHWQAGHRGAIHCAELGPDGVPTETRQVLACEYHLSYPFVFGWRDETYMLPETQQNKTVEVYRAIDFPWRWERAAVLLKDVAAADPTIFEYEGKLWLFVAGLSGAALNSSELSLFFCDSLFGEWQPHPGNPIVCDVRRARPAGALFTQAGVLIRPGQDCSVRYGCAITLNRVDVLSETEYREVPIATILPNWMPGICATHTLNRSTGIQVLDAVARRPRYAFLGRRFFTPGGVESTLIRKEGDDSPSCPVKLSCY
jgi:hypothetical protein